MILHHWSDAAFVLFFSTGLYDVLFLYLTKSRGFTNSLFSLFTGGQAVLQSIGNILAMYIFKKVFNLTEPMINIVAAVGKKKTTTTVLCHSYEYFLP